MKLSSLIRPENLHHCPYGDRREMASLCRYAWLRYLDTVKTGEPPCDVMVWEIGPKVSIRPASSQMDENHKGFVRPLPIFFELKGLPAARRKVEKQKNAASSEIRQQLIDFDAEVESRMQEAIMGGFRYKHVTTAFKRFQKDPLTVVTTFRDAGLGASEFNLVWKNKTGPTLAEIHRRARACRSKPLPEGQRNPSIREVRLNGMKEEHKQWKADAKVRVAQEKVKVRQRTPKVREELLKKIHAAENRRLKLVHKSRSRKASQAPAFLLSLGDGNQLDRIIVPTVPIDQVAEVIVKYPWSAFDRSDNRVWEYMTLFIKPALQKSGIKDPARLWLKLNRPQKVVYALLNFIGESDNGGVWQFLFNDPRLTVAALEAFQEIGDKAAARDYRAVLQEMLGKEKSIADLIRKTRRLKIDSPKRWQTFAQGYEELQTAREMEKTLFTKARKASLYKRICDYAESQLHLLAEIKTD